MMDRFILRNRQQLTIEINERAPRSWCVEIQLEWLHRNPPSHHIKLIASINRSRGLMRKRYFFTLKIGNDWASSVFSRTRCWTFEIINWTSEWWTFSLWWVFNSVLPFSFRSFNDFFWRRAEMTMSIVINWTSHESQPQWRWSDRLTDGHVIWWLLLEHTQSRNDKLMWMPKNRRNENWKVSNWT